MLTIVTTFPIVMRVTFGAIVIAFLLLETPTSQIRAAVVFFYQLYEIKKYKLRQTSKFVKICAPILDWKHKNVWDTEEYFYDIVIVGK